VNPVYNEEGKREVARLKNVFKNYWVSGVAKRWNATNPGNRAMLQERRKVTKTLLEAHGFFPLANRKILDVGCGGGGELAGLLEWGAKPENLNGVDLLPDRIEVARAAYTNLHFEISNAESLSFPDVTFDIVVLFTVLSSILDENMALRVANEIARVLRPGGALLFYDFRYRNPYNPNTRPITKKHMAKYFPGFKAEFERVTLLPPLARRLGMLTPYLYTALTWAPFLRTHYIALLIKP
jgi:ubiquinone/menaquinone biosynthesis C-methylase UbiE